MTNDLLIRSFSADLQPVRRLRSVDLRTVVWAAFALLCVSIGTCALGTRPDLAGKIRDPAFLCEGALLLALFALSARTAFQASVPGAEPTPVAKTDVDLVERTITVRHSYARDTRRRAGTPMSSQSRLPSSRISRQRSRRHLRAWSFPRPTAACSARTRTQSAC